MNLGVFIFKNFISGVIFGLGFIFSILVTALIIFNSLAPRIKEFLTNIN